MTKRLAITLALSLFFAINAIANVQQKAPRCQGVLSEQKREQVNASAVDPAATFPNAHPRGKRMPVQLRCASQLWQTQHPLLTRDDGGLKRARYTKPERKQRGGGQIRTTGNGNGNAYGHNKDHGKPEEIVIKKAGSSKADLRTLPQVAIEKIERP